MGGHFFSGGEVPIAMFQRPFRKRAMTLTTVFDLKRVLKKSAWQEHMLRRPLRVKRVAGETSDLPESELGPRASLAKWARRNHMRPWWARTIHPNSYERRLWDALTGLWVLLSVAQVPLHFLCSWWPYLRLSPSGLDALNLAMRVWFACEIVLNLRTGYVTPSGTLVMDGLTIARKHLLSGWLLLDLLGVINLEALLPVAKPPLEPPRKAGLVGWAQRAWRGASRVARFASRVVRGKWRREEHNSMADAWAWSALAYRCKRGTADTALSYCEWHESRLEQVISIWRVCRQLHVPRLLKFADSLGYFWQVLHFLTAAGCALDRAAKLLYLTKWAKLRRLLHLTQLWRIGRKWLAMREAQTREALRGMQDAMVKSISRHSGLDTLEVEAMRTSLARGELRSLMRTLSKHAGLDQQLLIDEMRTRLLRGRSRIGRMVRSFSRQRGLDRRRPEGSRGSGETERTSVDSDFGGDGEDSDSGGEAEDAEAEGEFEAMDGQAQFRADAAAAGRGGMPGATDWHLRLLARLASGRQRGERGGGGAMGGGEGLGPGFGGKMGGRGVSLPARLSDLLTSPSSSSSTLSSEAEACESRTLPHARPGFSPGLSELLSRGLGSELDLASDSPRTPHLSRASPPRQRPRSESRELQRQRLQLSSLLLSRSRAALPLPPPVGAASSSGSAQGRGQAEAQWAEASEDDGASHRRAPESAQPSPRAGGRAERLDQLWAAESRASDDARPGHDDEAHGHSWARAAAASPLDARRRQQEQAELDEQEASPSRLTRPRLRKFIKPGFTRDTVQSVRATKLLNVTA